MQTHFNITGINQSAYCSQLLDIGLPKLVLDVYNTFSASSPGPSLDRRVASVHLAVIYIYWLNTLVFRNV